jgi:hypothetical protein
LEILMTSLSKACLGLFVVILLAACGPNATPAAPTATEAPTLQPTATTAPSETPLPSETPDMTALTAAVETNPEAPETVGTEVPEAAAANPSAGGAAPEKYTYLGQDIPDRTQFLPNRTVTITWTVQNTGTVPWTKDYTLRYFAGPKPATEVYPFTKDVPVNDTINFVVTFTTPAEHGEYDLWFKLTNASNQNFGDLDLVFTVSSTPGQPTAPPKE